MNELESTNGPSTIDVAEKSEELSADDVFSAVESQLDADPAEVESPAQEDGNEPNEPDAMTFSVPPRAEGEEDPEEEEDDEEEDYEDVEIRQGFMQNRELSWLTFNERVLDQGADESVPLLERLNFISIFWSNLREFFMVRVGSLTDLSFIEPPVRDSKTGMTTVEQIKAIHKRCREL